MVPSRGSSAQADDRRWVERTTQSCLLPRKLAVMAKPMAQHSQPMRLPGRRARITAPTVAKAQKGTQTAIPAANSWAESPSLASRNPITSPQTRTTSSHRPQASQDAERGAKRSCLADWTTLGGEGSPVWRSMVAPSDPHPAWQEYPPRPSRERYEARYRPKRGLSVKARSTVKTPQRRTTSGPSLRCDRRKRQPCCRTDRRVTV